MASEQDVIAAVEAAAKIGGKAMLTELAKDGGAISLQIDVLAPSMGTFGPEVAALVKPFIGQVVAAVVAKLG